MGRVSVSALVLDGGSDDTPPLSAPPKPPTGNPAGFFLVALLCRVAFIAGCSKDVVEKDIELASICGDGVVESGEGCDTKSPGCVACQVVPLWSCPNNVCTQLCGDGVVGTGADCTNPQRDTDCDMTGYWAARETDFSRDAVVGHPQAQSGWRLYQFTQTGSDFVVTAELDCGIHITGSSNVDFSPGSLRGLIYINRNDGGNEPIDGGISRPVRHGSSVATGGGCAVSLDRWYYARGLVESLLPPDFSTDTPFSALPPIPTENDPVNGTDWPAGATDPDGDGIPGIAFDITGIVQGVRNSAQRIWRGYATPAGAPVAARAVTFVVPGTYDLEENVLRVTNCARGTCPLLASGSHVANDLPVTVTMTFLGRTLSSPRVSSVILSPPRQDLNLDLTTCAR